MDIDVRSFVLPSFFLDCVTIDDEGNSVGNHTASHPTRTVSSQNALLASASVLQCTPVYSSVLQCTPLYSSVLQCTPLYSSTVNLTAKINQMLLTAVILVSYL